MQNTFTNWSKSVTAKPENWYSPKSVEEIQQIIIENKHGRKIRVKGSGHSFTPLVACNDIMIDLNNYHGLIEVDKERKTAKVKAGTTISQLGNILFEHNLAQINLGDIDAQTIAGAISTGTHGTGLRFGNISTQIVEIEFINGSGEFIRCSNSENQAIFKCAQISLGAIGIITAITLQLQDSYVLEFTSSKMDVHQAIENVELYNKQNRNFEFYWFPYTKVAQLKFSNESSKQPKQNAFGNFMDDFLENDVFNILSKTTLISQSFIPRLAKLSAALVSTSNKVNQSHKVYALPRRVLFNEMEYNIPYEHFADVKRLCIKRFGENNYSTHFPTENRFAASDDIWLSPAYNRISAYIAFHAYRGQDYQTYFADMEAICLEAGGRPHWGKMHTLTAVQLEQRYPMFNEFVRVKEKMDPNKIFETPYIKTIFEK